jgi:N-acetylneuraminate lyase
MQTSSSHTAGLVAAPPTAFHEDGSVDFAAVAPLAAHLQRQGVSGVFVNGTTGEGMSLTTEEREQLAQAWRHACPAGMKMFVHVGHNCLAEAQRLTRHAQSIGADAVAALAPGFFKPVGIPGLVDWCSAIASAAPKLPFYFYHIPSMSGVHASVASLLESGTERIPNLAGAKFTFEALSDYQEALRLQNGRFDMLWGRDEMLLGALATGAVGTVGSTYNVAAPLYLRLMAACQRGDYATARDLQAQSVALIKVMVGTGNFFAALKFILQQQGVPIAPRVRLPLVTLADAALAPVTRLNPETLCNG